MSSAQDKIVLASTVAVESVWFYAAFSILALMMSLPGSPMAWIAAAAVMGVSLIVARTLYLVIMPVWMPYTVQMALGVLVIYLTLGSQVQSAGQGFDLGWITSVRAEDATDNYTRSVALAGLFSALLWWRGGRLAATEFPLERLSFTFRMGLIVLSAVAVVDMLHSADLKMFPLMFVYFASGLIGLSIGHIFPADGRPQLQQKWSRVIGVVVVAVMVVGLLFSLLQKGALSFITTPLGIVLNALAVVVFYVVIVPMVYIIEFIVSGIFWLISQLVGEQEGEEFEFGGRFDDMLEEIREEAVDSGPSIWADVLEWTIITIIVLIVLLILSRAFRRTLRWRGTDADGARESLVEDADPALDMARLLFDLLPERFRRRKVDDRLRLPEDEQNIVDVFRVYFGMLDYAEERGLLRKGEQTPSEFQSSLEEVLPQRLVSMATAAFNRACYGHRPTSTDQIAEMRQMLEQTTGTK